MIVILLSIKLIFPINKVKERTSQFIEQSSLKDVVTIHTMAST